MRILFTLIGNSRRSNYLNGESLRYGGGGGSGTDTSTILVAEYLASQGHEVVITCDKLEPLLEKKYAEEGKFFPKGEKIRGVQYTDIDLNFIDNKEFDILINSLWFSDYDKLPIKVTKGLIYWCHMQWLYGIDEIINFAKTNNLKIGFVNISEWEKGMNKGTIERVLQERPTTKTALIPNPVCDDVIRQVLSENIKKKPHKFIFHASWARGGNVAVDAIDKLELADKELHAFDYLITIHEHQRTYFHKHDGVDKLTLFRHLAESEYFLYPLYTPYQDVHKDTFSCVVAEAIALGVTPITYPLGALPEYFNDYCQWIKCPDGANFDAMQSESLSKDIEGHFKNNIDNILDKIYFLEQNSSSKEKTKQSGSTYILDTFNTNRIGNMWVDFIDNLLK